MSLWQEVTTGGSIEQRKLSNGISLNIGFDIWKAQECHTKDHITSGPLKYWAG